MKAARILLFMSPLLYLMPPLISVNDSTGLALLNYFYRGMIGAFPANAIMAFLCYTYADHLGREWWWWVLGCLRFPFVAPFILAFMPPKHGSAAASEQKVGARLSPAKAAAGPFESRFPLLSAYLGSKPPEVGQEARARMELVGANFEFSAFVDQDALNALTAGATQMNLTLWTHPEDSGVRVFGAGIVATPNVQALTEWLRKVAPKRKVATAIHPNDGPTTYFEYYPSAE
jgi:hypothetical protein